MKTRLIFATLSLLMLFLTACGSSSGKEITIHYAEKAQFELIDLDGNRVLIDVHNPDELSTPPTEADILLTTHGHRDHLNSAFVSEFPGEQLFIQVGEIYSPGISIIGIASAHTNYSDDEFQEESGSNYIYIIEMGGLRIAHFGDIGQDELSSKQLEELGEVDIALAQFVNSYSQMDVKNKKGFNLMNQVNPKVIIPTHGNDNMDAINYANEIWHVYANPSKSLAIRGADLGESAQFVIVGVSANAMQTIFDLPQWKSE